ncbi:MAG TPA: hypothetical protein VEA39_04280 [Methylophilaceae bacterium]|nr:hypothetical protein [Methylophilaceae bacterium]
MQVVEVTQTVPQTGNDNTETSRTPAQDQIVKEEETRSILNQIRNISAFGDCV